MLDKQERPAGSLRGRSAIVASSYYADEWQRAPCNWTLKVQRSAISKPYKILITGCVLVIGTVIWWFAQTPGPAPASTPRRPTSRDIRKQLEQAADNLRKTSEADAAERKLAELRTLLPTLPADAAVIAIREALQSNVDSPTHMKLTIGPGGALEQAPSLRIFLLDYLAQLDPPSAATEAEKVLSRKTSPDEWAIALRNYARVHESPVAQAFLREKFEEMVHYEEWQTNASVGFLQAFDLPVFLGGTELVPVLTELLKKTDNQAVAHAAYLALDRLVLKEPAALLTTLQGDPELIRGREVTRANYFARANLSDVQQKAVVETYLLDPNRLPGELNTFAKLYPNRNLMLSYNLLTTASPPDPAPQMNRDRFALSVLKDWMDDPRFTKLRPQLETMKTRLEAFVKR